VIVGRGLIARAFEAAFGDDAGVVIFASGCSNSDETSAAAFAREEALLRETLAATSSHVVYFSTCSVVDPERNATPYVRHKLAMERLASQGASFSVFRLPQVAGHTDNPHTLMSFLHSRIAGGATFAVWRNAWRNIIDVEDMAAIATEMIRDPGCRRRVLNIASPSAVRVPELVRTYERVLGVAARVEEIDRGSHYDVDIAECSAVAGRLGIEFGPDYVERVVRKYYGRRRED
jgi:nucleoside-diphosphate-sugar epimerase